MSRNTGGPFEREEKRAAQRAQRKAESKARRNARKMKHQAQHENNEGGCPLFVLSIGLKIYFYFLNI